MRKKTMTTTKKKRTMKTRDTEEALIWAMARTCVPDVVSGIIFTNPLPLPGLGL